MNLRVFGLPAVSPSILLLFIEPIGHCTPSDPGYRQLSNIKVEKSNFPAVGFTPCRLTSHQTEG